MNQDLEHIFNHLKNRLQNARGFLPSPFIYLDPEGVLYLFRDLTSLEQPPSVRVSYRADGAAELNVEYETGAPPPLHVLYEAMAPILKQKVPRAEAETDLERIFPGFALVNGVLRGTRFPDGNLNLEIAFGGVRGLLFYQSVFFNSMFRPLLGSDRLFQINYRVNALVFIQDQARRQIFYHNTHGDNMEHSWVPLAPVVIEVNPAAEI